MKTVSCHINFSPFPTGTKTRLIIPLRCTDIERMQTLGSYFNVLLMLVPARCYMWNMEWASQLKRDPHMSIHTINSSVNLRLRWAKKYTKLCDCWKNRPAGITDKMNAADLLCMQECRQTRDRTNGHLVDSNTLLMELSNLSVKAAYSVIMNIFRKILFSF